MFQTWLRYAHAGRDRFDTGSRTDRWEEAPLSALASDATGTQFHPRTLRCSRPAGPAAPNPPPKKLARSE